MTTFSPAGFGPASVIGPHQGIRVTFAETRSVFTPDAVEAADFQDNLAHLVDAIGQGGFSVVPASDVVPAPGELAATIDFVVPGSGSVAVSHALTELQAGMYGPLDLLRRTYIRDVQQLGGGNIGSAIPMPGADAEASPVAAVGSALGSVALTVGVLAVLGLAFVYAPEIKAGLKARTVARR